LRADEKHIRTQSAILDKNNPNPSSLLSITLFSMRMRFSSVWKTGLARAARNGRYSHAIALKTPNGSPLGGRRI
jgi:hypothetical protein